MNAVGFAVTEPMDWSIAVLIVAESRPIVDCMCCYRPLTAEPDARPHPCFFEE